MEMRELRAHEIARKAAACWAIIDETIPGLLKTMVLREMADIGWTLPLLAPSCGNLTRQGVQQGGLTVQWHLPLAGEFCAGLDAIGVD